MADEIAVDLQLFAGPSTVAPYPACVAEFSTPFSSPLAASRLAALFAELLPSTLAAQIPLPQGELPFENVAGLVAAALHDLAGPCDLPLEVQQGNPPTCRLVLGYHDAETARWACETAVQITNAVFSRAEGGPDPKATIHAAVQQTSALMLIYQPDFIARALMRVARARGIPVYPVAPGSRIWRYGQGSAGMNFFEAANECDSFTGSRLTQDKFLSNRLVTRLGLPGVAHVVARSAPQAMLAVRQLGFPLVVKPRDRGKGMGVTAHIASDGELEAAFAKASAHTNRGVLIERQVAGDDHRLAVFGGRLKWAVRRLPPRVHGNGQNTLHELIARENSRRSEADIAAGFVSPIEIDTDMLQVLAKQGLTPDDRPQVGRSVRLRNIANVATGGTIEDCSTKVHPDNRAMAETIARSFHMDALGIDFMTTDISISWRDLPCAVIEINATPGFSSDGRAEIILADKFPPGADGRLPTVVLVTSDRVLVERVTSVIASGGLCVGETDATTTRLAGQRRCSDVDLLPARVLALVLDPACEALVIATSRQELSRHGFPLDRADLVLIDERTPLPDAERDVVDACARHVVDGVNPSNFEATAKSLLVGVMDKTPVRAR